MNKNIRIDISSGQCIELCPRGSYYDVESDSCLDCHPFCSFCETGDNNATDCLSCSSGYMMTN